MSVNNLLNQHFKFCQSAKINVHLVARKLAVYYEVSCALVRLNIYFKALDFVCAAVCLVCSLNILYNLVDCNLCIAELNVNLCLYRRSSSLRAGCLLCRSCLWSLLLLYCFSSVM